jgi:hypothetical protein
LPLAGDMQYDAVMMCVDRYSKCIIAVPTESTADAQVTARRYLHHVYPIAGLPKRITSDRDPKFTSDFWESLHKLMGTRLHMTTANFAQSDGAVERQIDTLNQALRSFCGYGLLADATIKVDWVDVLPAYCYAYNSSVHASTGQVPYILERGYVPRGVLDAIKDALPLQQARPAQPAKEWVDILASSASAAKKALDHAFEYNKARYDKGRKEVDYEPGAQILMSTKFITFEGTPNKLKQAYIGPFKVIRMIGSNAVHIDLPPAYGKRHPVFPVSLLKPYAKSNDEMFPDRRKHMPEPPAVELGEEGDELVESSNTSCTGKATDSSTMNG